MPQIWRPLINFIDTATEGNFSKSGIVSEFHDSALFAHKSIFLIKTKKIQHKASGLIVNLVQLKERHKKEKEEKVIGNTNLLGIC